MYLAPLNMDWFFKKVFSDIHIAKSFLQDLLKVRITEIRLLGTDYKLSDDAVIVRFDFRCKINGKYVQIEMQQNYKTDVNKRFYLYQCVNTALQLETLEPIVITKQNGETYTEKNYNGIEPAVTIVWMVDDTLNFTEDVVVFSTLPEAAKDFITDKKLWQSSLDDILKARDKTLKIINNKTKNLDFFAENKIIYLFQSNICKNKNKTALTKWADLAQKSKNPNNTEQDFSQYKNDKIMAEVIRRLERKNLQPTEQKIADYIEQVENSWLVAVAIAEKKADDAVLKAEKKADDAVLKAEKIRDEERSKANEERLKAVNAFLRLGKDIAYIAEILDIPVDEIKRAVEEIEARKR